MNKKLTAGMPQRIGRQGERAPQLKPAISQLKTGGSAQSVKRPVAPPAYRLQKPAPNAVQAKMGNDAAASKAPAAPPVYRPQPLPRLLQPKMPRSQHRNERAHIARDAVQLAKKKVVLDFIGEEGKITVGKSKYKGYLFLHAKPPYWEFSHEDTPWPITRDFKGCASLEYESAGGKKRTLIPYPDGGINAPFTFLNRNGSHFFRLIFDSIE